MIKYKTFGTKGCGVPHTMVKDYKGGGFGQGRVEVSGCYRDYYAGDYPDRSGMSTSKNFNAMPNRQEFVRPCFYTCLITVRFFL